MKNLIVVLIKVYQVTFSPIFLALFGHACRFRPTCSEYAKLAIVRYGVKKGSILSLKRIGKCHPFSNIESSFDPVP